MSTIYSFQDVNVAISQPNVGFINANGTGLDSVVIDYATDRSVQDVAADGSVITSKIIARNGTIILDIQQTSDLNAWLLRWFNYIDFADPSQWANTSINVRANSLNQTTALTGVSPTKPGQRPYKAQGQKVTWTLMAQQILEY